LRIVRRVLLVSVVLVAVATGSTVAWAAAHGYRMYIVHTGSMVPALRYGDIVIDRPVQLPVHKDEIITFLYNSGPEGVVTHRAISDTPAGIRTKGDANPTRDPWTIHPDQVVGTPMLIVPVAGYLLYYLKQPAGAASVATVALGIWLLWDLFFGATTGVPDERGTDPGRPDARRRRLPLPRHRVPAPDHEPSVSTPS